MEVYKNNYCVLHYNSDAKILSQIWNEKTNNMEVEDYKVVQLETVNQFRICDTEKLFVDVKDFKMSILPEIQSWTELHVMQPLISSGIAKIAYLLPTDIFAQVSIDQTLEENKEMKFPYKYFDSENEAYNWLLN